MSSILSPQHDPMGAAIKEYYQTGKAGKLRVLSSMFEEDEIPVAHLFRSLQEMSPLEQKAISMARGRILDVGAGAGCHSVLLDDVTAIDISPLSCEVMQERGIKNVLNINLFDESLAGPFDTILMLMNGTGIIGKLKNMPDFLDRIRLLLSKGGQLLVDSSDLKYLYENEDGTYDIDPLGTYYGEIDYQMIYKKVKGEPFDWLYVDFNTLKLIAENNGFNCIKVLEGDHFDYLAQITLK